MASFVNEGMKSAPRNVVLFTSTGAVVAERRSGFVRMRIVFCWTHISGYMAACWRELAKRKDIDVCVISLRNDRSNAPFTSGVMEGVEWIDLPKTIWEDYRQIRSLVAERNPEIIVNAGWNNPAYVQLSFCKEFARTRFILAMDNPFRGDLRQRFGRLWMNRYLRRMDHTLVPGERAWQFAKSLGISENRISKGLYGVDYESLCGLWERRRNGAEGWPKTFLYIGQYIERKGIDILLEAYSKYHSKVVKPWPLFACGSGPLQKIVQGQTGVHDLGFVQPEELVEIIRGAGVFVLPSKIDAWPLAIVEACSGGLPVICTSACGSSVELVHHRYNGYVVPAERPLALLRGLVWAHENHDNLPEVGRRSLELSAPYSASCWSDRFCAILWEMMNGVESE